MRIFITGATGFIGTHLVRRLSKTKHQLCCLIRDPGKAGELKQLGASILIGDVTDKACLREGMRGCDGVIHLANLYSFWEPDNRIYRQINIEGTRNVMQDALEMGVSKVVHVSTAGIYGRPTVCPFTEESPVGPVRFSRYFQTKYEGDQVAWEFYEKKGLPLVVVYPGSVLGPGDPKASGQYIQNLLNRRLPATIFDDSILTFVCVQDVAEALVRALEKEKNIGEKYLVGKYRYSFRELNQMIGEISGIPLPKIRLPGFMVMMNALLLTGLAALTKKPPLWGMSMDQMRTMRYGFCFDGSKAERDLGLSYTPIRTALEEAIASYRQ